MQPESTPDFNVLVTADEAWPVFERAVLAAKTDIVAGFRIFDMCTKLRSPEAREIGDDWFDLLAHAVRRGVSLRLVISDFDADMATPLHELAWRTVRQGKALEEIADAPMGRVTVRAALHPAQPGLIPWLAFLPAVLPHRLRALKQIRGIRRRRQAVGLDKGSLPEMHTVSHHQKLAVIDGEVLYVGGLDLNERRYDSLEHDQAASQTWSDVQLVLRGPEAAEARQHLMEFEDVCAGKAEPSHLPLLKRTMSAPRRFQMPFLSPRTVLSEIEEAHLAAFRNARHLVYLETQFLRSGVISDALAAAAVQNKDLTSVVVLPGLPEEVAFDDHDGLDARFGMALQRQAVKELVEAFGKRITFAVPVRPVMADREERDTLAGSPLIHVHNKVLVRDDDYGIVGSANLNGRSMRWDTEVAVETTLPDRVAMLRRKLIDHWWWCDLPDKARAPETLQDWWRAEIARNAVRMPEHRTGFLVPYDADNEKELEWQLPGVTENIV